MKLFSVLQQLIDKVSDLCIFFRYVVQICSVQSEEYCCVPRLQRCDSWSCRKRACLLSYKNPSAI